MIYQPHGLLGEELPFYFSSSLLKRFTRRVGALFDRRLPRRADMVVCMHRGLSDAMKNAGIPEDRIRIIPPAVNFDNFTITTESSSTLFTESENGHTAGKPPLIVYTGNLDRYQNLPLLAESMAHVTAAVPAARLVIVTESDQADLLSLAPCYRRGAAAAGSSDPAPFESIIDFHLTGDFEAILQVMSTARVAVSPRTAWSGFPVKIVNYLAAGVPVVASSGSVRFMESVDGIVIPEDASPRSFAGALVRFLTDDRFAARVSAAASRSARERFSWKSVGPLLETACEHLPEQLTCSSRPQA